MSAKNDEPNRTVGHTAERRTRLPKLAAIAGWMRWAMVPGVSDILPANSSLFFRVCQFGNWCRAEDWASWMWQLLIRTTHIRRRFIPFIAVHFCLFFFSSLFWLIRRVHNTDFPIQCEWCTLFIYLRCFLFDMFVGRFCFFFFVFHFRVRLRIVRECKHANWNGDEANEICARAGRLSVECWCMYAFAASLIFAFMVVSFEWWRQEHHMHRIQNDVHFLTQAWCEECVWHDVWIIVCLCALPTTYSLVRYTKRGAVEHV